MSINMRAKGRSTILDLFKEEILVIAIRLNRADKERSHCCQHKLCALVTYMGTMFTAECHGRQSRNIVSRVSLAKC
jgi:hypothetical protein